MDEVKKNLNIGAELALPDELPSSPDLSHLPPHILRSNAIETLLQQNEELMSRLAVNLRRITHLENVVEDQESKVKKFKHHYDIVKDEVFILKEKADSSVNQFKIKQNEFNEVSTKYKAIDFEYSQLFKQSNEQKKAFLNTITQLNRRLTSYIKYKSKLKPILNDFKERQNHLNRLQDEYSGQNKILKDKVSTLTSYLQEQSDSFVNEKKELLKQFDKDSEHIEDLNSKLKAATERTSKVDEELVKLRNENIKILRTTKEQTEASEKLTTETHKTISSLKQDAKTIKQQNLDLKVENEDLKKVIEQFTTEHKETKEQLENTQMFFASLQKQFEKEQTKTSSLQKINRRLSQEMNSYRSTIQSLKNIRDEKQINKNPKADTIHKIEDLIFEIERDFR